MFDFECKQHIGEHIPNFAVAQKICPTCIDSNVDSHAPSGVTCSSCGEREKVFQGSNTTSDFCSWLFSENHRGYTAIAHNLKGYDGVFLLKYLVENTIIPRVTYAGAKIICIQCELFEN